MQDYYLSTYLGDDIAAVPIEEEMYQESPGVFKVEVDQLDAQKRSLELTTARLPFIYLVCLPSIFEDPVASGAMSLSNWFGSFMVEWMCGLILLWRLFSSFPVFLFSFLWVNQDLFPARPYVELGCKCGVLSLAG